MCARAVPGTLDVEYVRTIGFRNNDGPGRGFANPYDIAISKDRRIFVLNRCDLAARQFMRIGVCTMDEEYLYEFGNGFGSGDGQLTLPVAMAFDSRERLYVTDEYTQRVTVFDSSGEYLGKWGTHGNGDGQTNGPAGIAIDPDDIVYLVDQHNHRVQKFTLDGEYVGQWGTHGGDEGQFDMPWGIALDREGNVYVADWRNDRIQKFDGDGRFLAGFGESGDGDGRFNRPSGVAVDPEGHIYVADWGNERVQVLDAGGVFQLQLRGQATDSSWAEQYLDANPEERVERYRANLVPDLPPHLGTPHHVSAQSEPYFWGPVTVKLDPEGRMYVVESNRHRIQIYRRR